MSYGNPYANAPSAEAGQHEMQNYAQPYAQESNPYAQDGTQNYQQQQSYDAPGGAYGGYGGGEQRNDFFSKVTRSKEQIDGLDNEISRIDQKQNQALSSTNPTYDQQEVQELIQAFRMNCSNIRAQLQELKNEAGTNANKNDRVRLLMDAFKEKHRRLFEQEQRYQQGVRAAMERQYQIVNPGATPEEARQAVQDNDFNSQGGLFQQALMNDRTGQARSVLGNVQARHNEILKIEQQMIQLAELFYDLDTMVVQQEDTIVRAEQQTEQTNVHIGQGTKEIDRGIKHALNTRRNKWICFGIVVLICIIIAVGVGVGVTATRKTTAT